jgi:hypothetical protein
VVSLFNETSMGEWIAINGEVIFHGLFSTVCPDFSTNLRKQTQPSFPEITYEKREFTNACKTAQNRFR